MTGEAPAAGRRGVEPGKPKKAAPARAYRVADLVADYLAGHIEQGRSEAGALAARRRLQSAIEPVASRPAASITRSDAFDLLEAHKGTPTAAAKLRGLLGGAWDYALDARRLDRSGYGLVNAVTHYSQDVDDYDRATEFESLGGKLIELAPTEWKGLAHAA